MEQNNLMNSGGLNRFMAGQPRTNSPILYESSLASSSHINCIQDKYNEHQNDEQQRTYAVIATLYQPKLPRLYN